MPAAYAALAERVAEHEGRLDAADKQQSDLSASLVRMEAKIDRLLFWLLTSLASSVGGLLIYALSHR